VTSTHFGLRHLAQWALSDVGKDVGEIEQIVVGQSRYRGFYRIQALEQAFDCRFVTFDP